MKNNLLNNYRMGGYLLLAIGLINLRYQTGHSEVLQHSMAITIPGALLLAATWVPSVASKLHIKAVQAVVLAAGLLLVAYAVIN